MKLIDSNNAVTARWGIPGLKAAMEMIGLYGGDPRPPLVPLKEADREELQKVLTKTGFFPKKAMSYPISKKRDRIFSKAF
jgi:4-hydroxy-2-oxoglutarate aldolase